MDLKLFDRVLANGLWEKNTPSKPQVLYAFSISEFEKLYYLIDPEERLVISSSFPLDVAGFRPEIIAWELAWRSWFAPWCCEPKVLEWIKLVRAHKMHPKCNFHDLKLSCTIIDWANNLTTMEIWLDAHGAATKAEITITPTNDQSLPMQSRTVGGTVDEILEKCKHVFAKLDSGGIVHLQE